MRKEKNKVTIYIAFILGDNDVTFEDFESFLAEGVCTIDFTHANVMTLYGVVNENDGRPLIILIWRMAIYGH